MRYLLATGCVGYVLLVAGCGGGSSTEVQSPPSYDPDAMTAAAMKAFDKDGNGSIEGAELDACPGLKAALNQIDKDKNRKISRDELLARLTAYKSAADGGNAVTAAGCVVTLGGKPVSGAEVTFTPEPFLADVIKPVTGTTDADGNVSLQPSDGRTGVAFGFYRITVKGAGVPDKYSGSASPLGAEVFEDGRSVGGPIPLRL